MTLCYSNRAHFYAQIKRFQWSSSPRTRVPIYVGMIQMINNHLQSRNNQIKLYTTLSEYIRLKVFKTDSYRIERSIKFNELCLLFEWGMTLESEIRSVDCWNMRLIANVRTDFVAFLNFNKTSAIYYNSTPTITCQNET